MDLDLAAANREQARFLPPSHLVEQGGVLYTASGTRFPGGPFNSVIGLEAECPDPARTLERARAFYEPLGRGFTVYVRAHSDGALAAACAAQGLMQMSDSPGMVLRERLKDVPLAPSVELRIVSTPADAAGFVDVVAAAYTSIGMPAEVTRRVFSHPDRWIAPHVVPVLLRDHEQPACAAFLQLNHGIAGVYWVGTDPDHRGKGHATALMRYLSNLGFSRGAAAVVLQATPFGEPVYRKLGYEAVTRYPWFLARVNGGA